MELNKNQIEAALLLAQTTLNSQDMPMYMKNRWFRALEKAKERLIEQPYFAWQPDALLIVSVPKEKRTEIGCRFYQANEWECRRVDKSGLCQAFFEGFPCWHRGAFLLLGIYFGKAGEIDSSKDQNQAVAARCVNQS